MLMPRIKSIAGVFALVLIASLAIAADEPTTKPSKSAKLDSKTIKLTQPWSKLTDLSDEQKGQINEIHQKALAEVKAIHDREESQIMALLSEPQKAELKKISDEEKAQEKSKRAEKKKDGSEEMPAK